MPTPHKPARQLMACFATLAMLVAPLALQHASAQPNRDQARQHYANGKHYFAKKKYRLAISEFQTANKLAPSPVLFFNIGLAYDHLGDKGAALKNYRDYLRGVPKAANRAQVQAKINRLDGELRAEAEAARKKLADEAAKRKAAEEARKKAAAKPPVVTPPVVPPPTNPGTATKPPVVPPTNPGTATKPPVVPPTNPGVVTKPPPAPVKPRVSTGDPGLDRVAAIDIGALRAKRDGTAGTTTPTTTNPTSSAKPNQRGGTTTAGPLADSKPKKSKPAYKQWWFWVVVGVSAVILVDIMSTNSDSSAAAPRNNGLGATILRF